MFGIPMIIFNLFFIVVFVAILIRVLHITEQNIISRIFIHYPIKFLTFQLIVISIAFFFYWFVYAPFMFLNNGFFDSSYGFFSADFDADRVTELHGKTYWTIVLVIGALAFIKNTINTEKRCLRRNKNQSQSED